MLLYIQKMTDEVNHSVKACVHFVLERMQASPIEQTIQQQQFNIETNAFLEDYFQYKYHYLLSEDDFMELKKMDSACFALRLLLIEVKKSSLTLEVLSDLFSSCTEPLRDLLQRVTELGNKKDEQVNRIKQLAKSF